MAASGRSFGRIPAGWDANNASSAEGGRPRIDRPWPGLAHKDLRLFPHVAPLSDCAVPRFIKPFGLLLPTKELITTALRIPRIEAAVIRAPPCAPKRQDQHHRTSRAPKSYLQLAFHANGFRHWNRGKVAADRTYWFRGSDLRYASRVRSWRRAKSSCSLPIFAFITPPCTRTRARPPRLPQIPWHRQTA